MMGVVGCGIAVGIVACGNKPEEPSAAKPISASSQSSLLRLTPEESSRMALEVVPVSRGQLLAHREFPATVQANENELAEVTTLIRGRVAKVYVDVGQDVKKGTLLAMLHSMDLGVAEGGYLKAAARLHEAELAHGRAKDLYQHKVVSLAELLRREAAMQTAQAEAHETKNRLELLGVPRQELERLDR
ncbi:MAG: efflux RND transporter periplasmic adaptor subunit, partial [Nitrospiraceae bacterium]